MTDVSRGAPAARLRCAPHNLACDAQGHCVLCRRERGLVSTAPTHPRSSTPSTSRPLGLSVLLVFGLAGLMVAAFYALRDTAPRASVASSADTFEPAGALPPETELRPEAETPSAARAPAEALPPERDEAAVRAAREAARAHTERMLRAAESERRAREARHAGPVIPDDPGALRAVPGPSSEVEEPTQRAEAALDRRVAELRREREREREERALARARERVEIRMYSAKWCGVCTRARNYMHAQGIAFVERDIDESASAKAVFHRLNPERTLPTLDIDGHVMTGFSPRTLEGAIERAARERVR